MTMARSIARSGCACPPTERETDRNRERDLAESIEAALESSSAREALRGTVVALGRASPASRADLYLHVKATEFDLLLRGRLHEVPLLASGALAFEGPRKAVLRLMAAMPAIGQIYSHRNTLSDLDDTARLAAVREVALSVDAPSVRFLPVQFAPDDTVAHAALAAVILVHLPPVCQATESAAFVTALRDRKVSTSAAEALVEQLVHQADYDEQTIAAISRLAGEREEWASMNALRLAMIDLGALAGAARTYRRSARSLKRVLRTIGSDYFLGA